MSVTARRLRDLLEPVTGQVYFAPECHAAYEALGFAPSPAELAGVAMPDGPAYFTSRGSVMGQVPGDVVAAAFAVFNPEAVIPAVAFGWSITDAATICRARTEGATAQLVRLLGPEPDGLAEATAILRRMCDVLRPEGRPLYSGVRSQGEPGTPIGDTWWYGDQLREFRGDSHTIAWVGAGFDAVEIGLLSELSWGLPLGSYIRSRAWSTEQISDATDRLRARGLLDGDAMTDRGREVRESVEAATDAQVTAAVAALGVDVDTLFERLEPWGKAIVDGAGYLRGGSPSDLATIFDRT
jgi:hypothetical protein